MATPKTCIVELGGYGNKLAIPIHRLQEFVEILEESESVRAEYEYNLDIGTHYVIQEMEISTTLVDSSRVMGKDEYDAKVALIRKTRDEEAVTQAA